ncbi:hypothetical protein [Herbaspirillum rubrisubalbicans]|uniref:hypothetical protein n=1 Tax=Herbaspirillum rubrisubalbicans TaxID=80842 RepID=UPI00148C5B79|nr:hypothetical protein [Herbaspirillum rubrisubalbicans]
MDWPTGGVMSLRMLAASQYPIKNKPVPVIIGTVNLLTTMQKVMDRKRNSRAMLKSSKKK